MNRLIFQITSWLLFIKTARSERGQPKCAN